MEDLPTNYYDDILSASMNGKKKFRLTYRNGTTEEVTIEDISEYDQYGSKFGAGDINKTNQAVNEKFDSGDVVDPMLTTEPGFAADAYQTKLQLDKQNKNMGGLRFGVDADGNYGYIKDGADTVTPFKKGYELSIGATATAADITEGKTALCNGVWVIGNRPAPSKIQSGQFTFGSASYETITKTIYFSPEFDTTPKVTYTLTGSSMSMQSVEVYKTHVIFKILHSHGNDHHSGTVSWTATV